MMIWFLGAMVLVLMVCLWFILKHVDDVQALSGKIIAHNAELLEDYTKLHQDYVYVKTQLQAYLDDFPDDDEDWDDDDEYWDDDDCHP